METEWTPEDEAAMREGMAISKSNSYRLQRSRKPHGVSKEDVQRNKEAKLLDKLLGK